MTDLDMKQMLEAGIHFGHKTRYWNPQMAEFIYGARNHIHIINLEHTLALFEKALQFIHNIAAHKGKVLFVGTKFAAQDIISAEAERCGMPYVNHRWLGGMLTNYKTVRQSIRRLKNLEERARTGALDQLIKKEALQLRREMAKLERSLGGIKDMGGLPDAVFIIDVGFEKIAVNEANRLGIPVIGVVDTNHTPKGVDYVIPGNDDAIRSIKFYAQHVADTILQAQEERTPAKEDSDEYIEVTAENSASSESDQNKHN